MSSSASASDRRLDRLRRRARPRPRALDAGHLFAVNLTRLAIRRGTFLRGYVYDFIETFASPLKRAVVDQALASAPGTRFEG
jgi:LysR family cys regulon transcriptional activator